jgi:hypothetical protein
MRTRIRKNEDEISALEDAAEGDVLGISKFGAVSPRSGVVVGQQHLSVANREGFVVALRVDVQTVGR